MYARLRASVRIEFATTLRIQTSFSTAQKSDRFRRLTLRQIVAISFRETRRSRALRGHGVLMQIARLFLRDVTYSAIYAWRISRSNSSRVRKRDALWNQRPDLPSIYVRRCNAPSYGWRSVKIKSVPWLPSNNARPRLNALCHTSDLCSHAITETIHVNNIYSHRTANNCRLGS